MKKALITGAAGFVGSHLTEHLLNKGIDVIAVVHPDHSISNLNHLKDMITIINADLTKKSDFNKISKLDTDYIFHLAAFSSPTESFKYPKETLENNIFCELYLLEMLASINSRAKILIVGSSDEYGNVKNGNKPINENATLEPASPYAVSKVAQDMLGYQFFLNHGLKIVRVRPFNHIGPRQSTSFVVPAFASQIAIIEQKGEGVIKVGNINTYRDFTDVRDIVRAYLLALDKGCEGEVYNIGAGIAYKIADILGKLISLSTAEIRIKEDKRLMRKGDVQKIYCDYSKFYQTTGWKPQLDLNKTLSDTINYERSKLKN